MLLPDTQSLEFDLDNVGPKNYLTHNAHPYPAKFIPQIPGKLLDYYLTGPSIVLDPFCGSGTVGVEASLRGHHCIANDLNPIAALATSAKTAKLTDSDRKQLQRLLDTLSDPLFKHHAQSLIPTFKNQQLWFSSDMLQELGQIRFLIVNSELSHSAQIIANCAFSAIVVKCSNQETETRWRSIDKHLPTGFASRTFCSKLADIINRSTAYSTLARGSCEVHTSNALSLAWIDDSLIDMVLTSPPYANSHDYYLYNKLRMFWLGYDHYAVQSNEIGSRHRHSDLNQPLSIYLTEMEAVISESVRVLKPNGILAIVIGDSVFKSQVVDMGACYQEIAKKIGLTTIFSFEFEQRRYTSAFQRGLKTLPKRSHILVFRRAKR